MTTTHALVAVVALLGVGACSQTVPRPGADKRILEIDGQSIYLDEFGRYTQDTLGDDEPESPDPAEQMDAATLSRLFDQFVEEQLLLQQALEAGVQVSDPELQAFLELQGLSEAVPAQTDEGEETKAARDRFQSRVRRTLLLQRFKDKVVLKDVRVAPTEIEKYFEDHPEEFQGRSRVVLRQILVDEEPLALKIRAELQQGASFQELGEQHTLAPDRGEPRQYEEADLPEEIRSVVSTLNPGETSDVVNIAGRYRLFRLEARQGKSRQTLEDVRDQIEFMLLRRMTDEVMAAYLNDLRSKRAIHVYYENLPFVYQPEASS